MDDKLTVASIYNRRTSESNVVNINISLSNKFKVKNYPFALIIQSSTENQIKLTIYPIKKDKIIKISLFGQNVSDKTIEMLSEIIKNYEIIHSSGLLIKKMKFFYECYLNLNPTDNEYKDLKGSLNKIRNIPLEVKIEEISLKSVKRL